jgi:hypothetical protein
MTRWMPRLMILGSLLGLCGVGFAHGGGEHSGRPTPPPHPEPPAPVALAAPILLAPADGATQVALATTLSWLAVASATSYTVQLSTLEDFSADVFAAVVNTTEVAIPSLMANTRYFWRVKAMAAPREVREPRRHGPHRGPGPEPPPPPHDLSPDGAELAGPPPPPPGHCPAAPEMAGPPSPTDAPRKLGDDLLMGCHRPPSPRPPCTPPHPCPPPPPPCPPPPAPVTDSDWSACWSFTTGTTMCGVDAAIQASMDAAPIGLGTVDTAGAQASHSTVARGSTARYTITVSNTGTTADFVLLTSGVGKEQWTIAYQTADGVEVTGEVQGTGWVSPSLAVGDSLVVQLSVTPHSRIAVDEAVAMLITATSLTDATVVDVVQAITAIRP